MNPSHVDYLSMAHQLRVVVFKQRKNEILQLQEEEWRLKGHALWVSGGDTNTKLLNNYAMKHCRENSIWGSMKTIFM